MKNKSFFSIAASLLLCLGGCSASGSVSEPVLDTTSDAEIQAVTMSAPDYVITDAQSCFFSVAFTNANADYAVRARQIHYTLTDSEGAEVYGGFVDVPCIEPSSSVTVTAFPAIEEADEAFNAAGTSLSIAPDYAVEDYVPVDSIVLVNDTEAFELSSSITADEDYLYVQIKNVSGQSLQNIAVFAEFYSADSLCGVGSGLVESLDADVITSVQLASLFKDGKAVGTYDSARVYVYVQDLIEK